MAETEKNTNDNMKLWNAVCTTDEKYTEIVQKSDKARPYHAIEAVYQIRQATEQWGMMAKDWHVEHSVYFENERDLILLVHVFPPGCERPATQYGGCSIPKKSFVEYGATHCSNQSHKKALTDGTTKCLSLFGISSISVRTLSIIRAFLFA